MNIVTANRVFESVKPVLTAWLEKGDASLNSLLEHKAKELQPYSERIKIKSPTSFLIGEGFSAKSDKNGRYSEVYREQMSYKGVDNNGFLEFERFERVTFRRKRRDRYRRPGVNLFYYETEKNWKSITDINCPHGTAPYNGEEEYQSISTMLKRLKNNADTTEKCIRRAYQADYEKYNEYVTTASRLKQIIGLPHPQKVE